MDDSVFYSSISQYYDHIFPLNKAQLSFIETQPNYGSNLRILDMGCGSGSLSLALAERGHQIDAIDYDAEMIGLANEKAKTNTAKVKPKFQQMDMREIAQHFPENSFDQVLCFGNTLVHLADMETIAGFINSMARLCKPGGMILIQLLHYQNIFTNRKAKLPIIENEKIRFERHYSYGDERTIDFKTSLMIKESGQLIQNCIPLYAIFKEELELLLSHAGLSHIKFYGNFNSEALEEDSIPLVVSAQKSNP